jgi:hypothetical protein
LLIANEFVIKVKEDQIVGRMIMTILLVIDFKHGHCSIAFVLGIFNVKVHIAKGFGAHMVITL